MEGILSLKTFLERASPAGFGRVLELVWFRHSDEVSIQYQLDQLHFCHHQGQECDLGGPPTIGASARTFDPGPSDYDS